jgi:hypothetical protein
MISIPLIGIILIVVIVILYFLIKRNPVITEENEDIFVLFNDPFFIKPHELTELVFLLASSTDAELTHVLILHGDLEVSPSLPLDKYFSMYDYTCVVTKTEPVNKDTFKVTLTFTKN